MENNSQIDNYSREQFIYLIQLCEKSGRYEDMLSYFETMVTKFNTVMKNEKILLEKPIKNIIQNKQKKLNKIYSLEKEASKQDEGKIAQLSTAASEPLMRVLTEEKEYIENEIKSICKSFISLIDNIILQNVTEKEVEVFFCRLKGDLYKYLSQVEEDSQVFLVRAEKNFKEALQLATRTLDVLNNTYLTTVYSYSKFLSSFMKDNKEAIRLLSIIKKNHQVKDILETNLPADQEIISTLNEINTLFDELVGDD